MWSLRKLLSLNSILGATGGVVSAFFYLAGHFLSETPVTIVLVFLGAPVFQALLLCLYTIIGYPVLKFMLKKGWLRHP